MGDRLLRCRVGDLCWIIEPGEAPENLRRIVRITASADADQRDFDADWVVIAMQTLLVWHPYRDVLATCAAGDLVAFADFELEPFPRDATVAEDDDAQLVTAPALV